MSAVPREQIALLSDKLKAAGKKVVFTNGCFDILHVGHVRYLAAARELGDCLIVGLNTDASVRLIKGPTRPINREDDRAEVLLALKSVDYVVLFGEPTANEVIVAIRPDVYAKGGDYAAKDLPEAQVVETYGGKTVLLPMVEGKSSTRIINKIKE
ncbi:D-glycero-beta-D-manno-heptose 1-phosphate adenylyltransferase [Propionispora hippei]|uniref:D-glycero-beta-D-manno-heptose 1-phosphate adenylyltransferase n=1 Tax=Propionispora hippei DSM 15287 TaxID=1123003 RepID=A0A1M6K4A8_9FIRM|nr:D-glycero-beta-D-manno-heptose 1-phosphate adenylyltransferase [Propionispora hippei]SHJ53813.1 rfaE bifunctional protein, domain II [Propionispora hippei DSM 15287]